MESDGNDSYIFDVIFYQFVGFLCCYDNLFVLH